MPGYAEVTTGRKMITTREEVHQLVDSLPEQGLDEPREVILEILREPVDLTDEELEEMEKGKEELRRSEWAWWEDIRRKDVSGSTLASGDVSGCSQARQEVAS